MRVAKLNDIKYIITIFEEYYNNLGGMEAWLSARLRNPIEYTYILNEENTALIIFERIGNYKCQFHIYSMESCRGKKLKKFCIEAAKHMIKHYNYTLYLTFIPKGMAEAEVFARLLGCTKVQDIEDAGGERMLEVLYMTTKQKFIDRFYQKQEGV